MTTRLDADTEKMIEAYHRASGGRRALIIATLNELGVDVQSWEEAEMVLRYLRVQGVIGG